MHLLYNCLIQEILSKSGSDHCDEKSGWFVSGTEDELREVLTQSINRQIARQRELGETVTVYCQEEGDEQDQSRSQEEEGEMLDQSKEEEEVVK